MCSRKYGKVNHIVNNGNYILTLVQYSLTDNDTL